MGTDDDARPAARLTVLAGPSGVGKDSVIELVRVRSPWVWLSVPVTTRPRRDHEIDGVHYRFVDRAEFARLLDGGQLLEWSEIGAHRYGTPGEPVRTRLGAGQPVLLSIDPGGARQVRAAMPEARLVYLAPPPADTVRAGHLRADHLRADHRRDRAGDDFDVTVINDVIERAADELVGLLGSSFLTPAQPPASG